MAPLQARGQERVWLRARLPERAPGPGSPELQPVRVQARVQVRAQRGPVQVQRGPVLPARVQRYPCHRRCYTQRVSTPTQDL